MHILTTTALILFAGITLAGADLIGWWPLDGTFDDGGNAELNGEPIGESTFEQASWLRLNAGDSDGVTIGASDGLNAELFSLGYRLNQDGKTQGNAGLERLTSREGDSFETAIGDANAVGGTDSETGTTLSYYQGSWNVTNVVIPEEGWVHVLWRNTESDMELYIDGTLEYTGPSVSPGQINGFMNIGIRHNQVEGYEGLIDDVFLWDDSSNSLTTEAIAAIASQGMAAFLGLDTDTDKDGLPNGWEEEHQLDPNDDGSGNIVNGPAGDPDMDALTNLEEFELGTNPRAEDSDGDGLSDGEEVTLETNPRSSDSDRDGLSDAEEVALATKPNNPDSDGDGFLDGFENSVGSDPNDGQQVPGADTTLVLYLDFDDTLADQSGRGNDGSALGEPVFENDVPVSIGSGRSLRFGEGDIDGVTIEASDDLNSDVFTLAYFINQDGAMQGNAGLERLTSRGGDRFETAIGDANAVGGDVPGTLSYYSPATGWTRTEATVPDSGWVHVAWRNSGTGPEDLDLFVDGVLAYTGAGVSPGAAGLMNVGIRHNAVEGYEGLMDELRLYSVVLSDDFIAAMPNKSAGGVQIVEVARGADGLFNVTWTSSPGQFFDVQKSLSLATDQWITLQSQVPAADAPAEVTSLSLEKDPQESQAFFRVGRVAPPALFSDDFESGTEGWTTGLVTNFSETATTWEVGAPENGPGAAHGGTAAYGTDLDANYENATGIHLRSPVIDFTGRGRTRLSFWYFVDVSFEEGGRVNLLDGEGTLIQSLKIYDGSQPTADWTEDTITLPNLDGPGMIEFEFLSDGRADDNGAGWFIDDVRIE